VIDRRTGNRTAANADRLLAAGPMAAHGTTLTYRDVCHLAAFRGEADISQPFPTIAIYEHALEGAASSHLGSGTSLTWR
jgi:hypothetical protein